MNAAINSFIDECRVRARVRPQLTEHIATIETALTNCFRAALGGIPKYLRLWADVERCISRQDCPVAKRLKEMGHIGDAFQDAERQAAAGVPLS